MTAGKVRAEKEVTVGVTGRFSKRRFVKEKGGTQMRSAFSCRKIWRKGLQKRRSCAIIKTADEKREQIRKIVSEERSQDFC